MQIVIDLGNAWEMFSAVGTVGATIVALCLACRESRKRLSVLFVWDAVETYNLVLILTNVGGRPIVTSKITLFYGGEQIFMQDILNELRLDSFGNYLIKSGETKRIKCDATKFKIKKDIRRAIDADSIKAVVQDLNGKKYVGRQKIDTEKLVGCLFGAGIFKD